MTERDIISGKLNDPGEVFQKHNITRVICTLCFAPRPIYTGHKVSIVIDWNVFLWPTCNFGDAPCSCRGWFPSMPYPLANSVTTSVPMHSRICSPTPEQVPQNKLNSWESCWDTVLLEEISSVAERPWTEWQDYHTILVCWDGKRHGLLFSVDTTCVTNSTQLQTCPGAVRAGLLQDKGWARSWEWPLCRLCPPWCIPQRLHPWAEPGGGHRVHLQSWILLKGQTRSRVWYLKWG